MEQEGSHDDTTPDCLCFGRHTSLFLVIQILTSAKPWLWILTLPWIHKAVVRREMSNLAQTSSERWAIIFSWKYMTFLHQWHTYRREELRYLWVYCICILNFHMSALQHQDLVRACSSWGKLQHFLSTHKSGVASLFNLYLLKMF